MSLRKVQVMRFIIGIVLIVLLIVNSVTKGTGNETLNNIMLAAMAITLAAFLYVTAKWKCPACKRMLPLRSPDMEYCPHCGEYLFYEEIE